jgi:NADPH-dependent 2,4-dienoyl-CoA reductase/sulfur reductase-like enzyme
MPSVKKQKVLIVGGGIGGIQAALTAAENGHEVILCEKTARLGGNIRCEEKVPFKKHLAEYIEQRERLLARSAVEIRLNTEVTPEYALGVGADVIIAALGATPIKPNIPGIDGKTVIELKTRIKTLKELKNRSHFRCRLGWYGARHLPEILGRIRPLLKLPTE